MTGLVETKVDATPSVSSLADAAAAQVLAALEGVSHPTADTVTACAVQLEAAREALLRIQDELKAGAESGPEVAATLRRMQRNSPRIGLLLRQALEFRIAMAARGGQTMSTYNADGAPLATPVTARWTLEA